MTPAEAMKRENAAARDVKLGVSIKAASKEWGVSKTTLTRRLQSVPPRSELNQDVQNPTIRNTSATIINYSRVNGATVANINLFFDRLDVPEVSNVPTDRYYNVDEIGIGQGVSGDHFVIDEPISRIALKGDVEQREWMTSLECISGDVVSALKYMVVGQLAIQSNP
ncbi:hypothetical protein GGS21DRAFT_493916 [Xylaria nigripes]|nr:hypothetical protein GGS21DRAFT_493916 [Xylaria nigripes]